MYFRNVGETNAQVEFIKTPAVAGIDLVELPVLVRQGGTLVEEVEGAFRFLAKRPDSAFLVAAHGFDLLLGCLDDDPLPLLPKYLLKAVPPCLSFPQK